jgi:hypothetical protein
VTRMEIKERKVALRSLLESMNRELEEDDEE